MQVRIIFILKSNKASLICNKSLENKQERKKNFHSLSKQSLDGQMPIRMS